MQQAACGRYGNLLSFSHKKSWDLNKKHKSDHVLLLKILLWSPAVWSPPCPRMLPAPTTLPPRIIKGWLLVPSVSPQTHPSNPVPRQDHTAVTFSPDEWDYPFLIQYLHFICSAVYYVSPTGLELQNPGASVSSTQCCEPGAWNGVQHTAGAQPLGICSVPVTGNSRQNDFLSSQDKASVFSRTLHVLDPNPLSSTIFSRNTALLGVSGTYSFHTAVSLHTVSPLPGMSWRPRSLSFTTTAPCTAGQPRASQSLERLRHRASQTERKCSFSTSSVSLRAGRVPVHLPSASLEAWRLVKSQLTSAELNDLNSGYTSRSIFKQPPKRLHFKICLLAVKDVTQTISLMRAREFNWLKWWLNWLHQFNTEKTEYYQGTKAHITELYDYSFKERPYNEKQHTTKTNTYLFLVSH